MFIYIYIYIYISHVIGLSESVPQNLIDFNIFVFFIIPCFSNVGHVRVNLLLDTGWIENEA